MASDAGPTSSSERRRPDRRRDARLILLGVAAVLLVWFALANLQEVEIHFWVFTAHTSLITVVAITGVLGGLIGVQLVRHRRSTKRGGRESAEP